MEHLSLATENALSILEEAEEEGITRRHWEELAVDKNEVQLAIDWKKYRELDRMGMLSAIAVRLRGKLVGYSIMILSTGLHYRHCFEATMDVFWVAPEVRGRCAGRRLFRVHEAELRRRGVKRVHAGSKLHKDCSRLFKALGYRPVELWHSKLLGD